MNTLQQNFDDLHLQIHSAEKKSQRSTGTVRLLAVSKMQSVLSIQQLYALGQRDFGENYLQEALEKQQQLINYHIKWHFIGAIQSNKTKAIARHFHWVHTVDRYKIAQRLSEQRPINLPPLNICLQVNISDEPRKSGVSLAELPALITAIQPLKHIRLRGVMAIPAPQTNYDLQCLPYRQLHQAINRLNLSDLDTFSYGMSADLTAAIAEGATIVRVGTALFGKRAKK